MRRLTIFHTGEGGTPVDVSNDCTLENRKANPNGWSQAEVHHSGKRIGWMESGYPMDFEKGYTFTDEDDAKEAK
jgi:hypothetical protein